MPEDRAMKARAPEGGTIESVGMALDRTAALLRRARLAYGTGTVDVAQEATWMIAHVLGVPLEGVGGCRADPVPRARRTDFSLDDPREFGMAGHPL